jgi:hypothetical protein
VLLSFAGYFVTGIVERGLLKKERKETGQYAALL